MKKIIIALFVIVCGAFVAFGQVAKDTYTDRFAIRLKADIGLTDAYATKLLLPARETSNHLNDYGIEFMWTFWNRDGHSIKAGTGFALGVASFSTNLEGASYSYMAGPSSDMDGNTYIRYTDIEFLQQKSHMVRMSVPVYLRYEYSFHKRWSVYGMAELKIGFGGNPSVISGQGNIESYGIYPDYDDLKMDDEWLNCFGAQQLSKKQMKDGKKAGADAAIMLGAGLAFQVYKPLYLTIGLNYDAGFTNILKGEGMELIGDNISEEKAPVAYTVEEGLKCRSLTDAFEKCRLNRLGLDIGLELRF